MARGRACIAAPELKPKTPPDLSLLRAKNGLDNGVHFTLQNCKTPRQKRVCPALLSASRQHELAFHQRSGEAVFAGSPRTVLPPSFSGVLPNCEATRGQTNGW